MALVVHKYGGSSVADADKILKVARRIGAVKDGGDDIVAVASAMGDTTDELIGLARTVAPEPDPRELDLLLSTGELVSCALLTMALRNLGYDAITLSGFQAGIRTDTMYGKARIYSIDPARVKGELAEGKVVIVAGFQGITDDLDITTLGRGGSDTTAVALAAALARGTLRHLYRRGGHLQRRPPGGAQSPQAGRNRLRGNAGVSQLWRENAPPLH